MKSDKLSFFQKTKLNIAKSVAPVKEKITVTFNEIDFFLEPPSYRSSKDFLLSNVTLSQDYCYSPENISITSISVVVDAELEEPKSKLIKVGFDSILIHDLSSVNELTDLYPEIENFVMKYKKPAIRGKIYSREVPKEFVAKVYKQRNIIEKTETEEIEIQEIEEIEEIIEEKPVIEQQYRDKNKFDVFDVFDLIFPALQPPMGKTFDNPIVFPRPL